jgi:2-methylcitrate dehydratase PrpD
MSAYSALLLFVAATAPMAATAQTAPDTLSLTDAQKAEIAGHATEDSVDAARAGLDGSGAPDRKVHGEMGVMIGSHGTRGAYGTAAIPLGDHAGAVVSFEKSRYGYPR